VCQMFKVKDQRCQGHRVTDQGHFKLGTGIVIKVDEDWRGVAGGLKLQCIAIATFSSEIYFIRTECWSFGTMSLHRYDCCKFNGADSADSLS